MCENIKKIVEKINNSASRIAEINRDNITEHNIEEKTITDFALKQIRKHKISLFFSTVMRQDFANESAIFACTNENDFCTELNKYAKEIEAWANREELSNDDFQFYSK